MKTSQILTAEDKSAVRGDGKCAVSDDDKSGDDESGDGKCAVSDDGKSASGKNAIGKSDDGKSDDGKSDDGKSDGGKSASDKSAVSMVSSNSRGSFFKKAASTNARQKAVAKTPAPQQLVVAFSLDPKIATNIATSIKAYLQKSATDTVESPAVSIEECTQWIRVASDPQLPRGTLVRNISKLIKDNDRDRDREGPNKLDIKEISIVVADGKLFRFNINAALQELGIDLDNPLVQSSINNSLASLQVAWKAWYQPLITAATAFFDRPIRLLSWHDFFDNERSSACRLPSNSFSYSGNRSLWTKGVLPLSKLLLPQADQQQLEEALNQLLRPLSKSSSESKDIREERIKGLLFNPDSPLFKGTFKEYQKDIASIITACRKSAGEYTNKYHKTKNSEAHEEDSNFYCSSRQYIAHEVSRYGCWFRDNQLKEEEVKFLPLGKSQNCSPYEFEVMQAIVKGSFPKETVAKCLLADVMGDRSTAAKWDHYNSRWTPQSTTRLELPAPDDDEKSRPQSPDKNRRQKKSLTKFIRTDSNIRAAFEYYVEIQWKKISSQNDFFSKEQDSEPGQRALWNENIQTFITRAKAELPAKLVNRALQPLIIFEPESTTDEWEKLKAITQYFNHHGYNLHERLMKKIETLPPVAAVQSKPSSTPPSGSSGFFSSPLWQSHLHDSSASSNSPLLPINKVVRLVVTSNDNTLVVTPVPSGRHSAPLIREHTPTSRSNTTTFRGQSATLSPPQMVLLCVSDGKLSLVSIPPGTPLTHTPIAVGYYGALMTCVPPPRTASPHSFLTERPTTPTMVLAGGFSPRGWGE